MESIKELYRIGHGPSSSHTMGPGLAAGMFLERFPEAAAYRITLYGSLAATAKGHLTYETLGRVFAGRKFEILAKPDMFLSRHPNALVFAALDAAGRETSSWTAYSVGGGKIIDDDFSADRARLYPFSGMRDVMSYCKRKSRQIWEAAEEFESPAIWAYLREIWTIMKDEVKRGLSKEGILPGPLRLPRKARAYRMKARSFNSSIRRSAMLYAYALAAAEENAAGGLIVTAPTCGSAGVLPAVLCFMSRHFKFSDTDILRALATAGVIGSLVKKNASISGAEVGCQGEIGTACAMASGAATFLFGGTVSQIEYSAEMGIEHHLGLTCDPVAGLVQIPCIERNALAAARALDHNTFALLSDGRHRISFDEAVEAMKQTGRDLSAAYKETSRGGLAVVDKDPI
ncbi:MAG: L-serine ammonia-lyase [Acidobacteriota bacterium]|nr:L-serine ammonia-lyase [Acidobacteriota bacterium]